MLPGQGGRQDLIGFYTLYRTFLQFIFTWCNHGYVYATLKASTFDWLNPGTIIVENTTKFYVLTPNYHSSKDLLPFLLYS